VQAKLSGNIETSEGKQGGIYPEGRSEAQEPVPQNRKDYIIEALRQGER
jgi:hypothetical protein